MNLMEVLHMNEGSHGTSYASNSSLQQKEILKSMTIMQAAITDFCSRNSSKVICMADLGCSSGPNVFLAVSSLIKTIDIVRKRLGQESPEYQIFLNDLPGNDFNTIFGSLPGFQEKLRSEMEGDFGPCFFTGVSGSFYHRIFPTSSLHIVHSSSSLHWLSQVPEMSEANKGNISLSRSSPASVIKAYQNQFQKDFSAFLRCRAEELATGGIMILTIFGRESEDPCSDDATEEWDLLAIALNDMVFEGLIEEQKLDSFNLPTYQASAAEIKSLVEMEGSFSIDRLETTKIPWDAFSGEDCKDIGYNVAKTMRAVVEPLMVSHFGEEIIDEVFCRYKTILDDRIPKIISEGTSLIVSMTKKGI